MSKIFWAVALVLAASLSSGALPADDAPPPRPAFANEILTAGLDLPLPQVQLADLNGDGWLDVLANSSRVFLSIPTPRWGSPESSRMFIETTEESGIGSRPVRLPRAASEPLPYEPARASFLITGDVDNDGDLDLFSAVRCELEFWQKDETTGEPLVDENGARVPTKPDRGFRNEIYLNDGEGHFTVVENAGVSAPAESTAAATFLDYDLDGVLDLFIGNWYQSYGWSYDAYPDRLFRGRGDGTFEDVTERAGLFLKTEAGTRTSTKPTYGVTSIDWNGDRFPDLFTCAYGRRWNQQWRNNGDGTFTEVAERTTFDADAIRSGHYPGNRRPAESPFRANGNTFDVSFADFDNDGDFDAFLAEITHAWAGSSSDRSQILENLGPTEAWRFERREEPGLARTHQTERWNQGDIYAGWIDADGDGREDLFISSSDYPDDQRLRLYLQDAEHRFHDRTEEIALDWPASSAPSVGDVDGDGDPDLLVARSLSRLSKERRAEIGDRGALLVNHLGDEQNWLEVRLRGRGAGGCNARGIGSRVEVKVGERTLHRMVQSASGHAGHQNPDALLIGIGRAEKVEVITVHWANAAGTKSVVEGLAANQRVTIFEPEGEAAARVEAASLLKL